MKTIAQLIAAATLATAGAAVQATETQPVTAFAPNAPWGFQAPTQEQLDSIAAQQQAFFEQQQAAMEQAMEAQRQFIEQQAKAFEQAMEAQSKLFEQQPAGFPGAPVAFEAPPMPEMPSFDIPSYEMPSFEMPELPTTPDLSGLDRDSRRTEMRKYSEQVREIMQAHRDEMRKSMEQRREAAKQERAKYLEQIGRVRPEV